MKKPRRWWLWVAVVFVILLIFPFFLPDHPPFRFLRGAELRELDVWWSGEQPTRADYRLNAPYREVLAWADSELSGRGYHKKAYVTKKGQPYVIFLRGPQEVVAIDAGPTPGDTDVTVGSPNNVFDHIRDFKFQFLSPRNRGD